MYQRILIGIIGFTLVGWSIFWAYTAVLGFRSLGADAILITDIPRITYPECRKCDTQAISLTLGSDSTYTMTEYTYNESTQVADTVVHEGPWATDSRRLALFADSGRVRFDYYLSVDGALQYMGSDSLLPVHTFRAKE